MPFRSPVLRLALLTASTLLALSGCDCGRECTVSTDCPDQGQVCDQGVCKSGPDGGPSCSPACPTNQFCDNATLTCKNCDGTFPTGSGSNRGCTQSAPICDTAANGGAGQCRSCAPTGTGGAADPGCGGSLPVCDPAGNGGNGVCVTCSERGGCGNGRICDVPTHSCHTCLASTDGGVAPGCSAGQPICSPTFNMGQGRCLVCTSTSGCTGGTICDPAANGGVGVCDYCRPATDGGVGQGCDAQAPVCDLSRDGGLGACIVCNASAGCGSPRICDVASNGGNGTCKYCYDGSGSPDPGCGSGAPVCNTAGDAGLGTCVGCLSSTDCTTAPNFVCDPLASRCKVCILAPAPDGCGASQVCDPSANGGQGVCLGCNGDPDCLLLDGGASSTPRCRTSPPPGACVECLGTPDCTDPTRPACGGANVCGCSGNPSCSGATGRPICDTAANNGNGVCVVCTPPGVGCTDPKAPVCSGGACVCPDNSVCPVGTNCTGSPASCQPTDQTSADAAIGQFLVAGATLPIRVVGAYVTYLKPQIGDPLSDPAGFFIQAIANGNSLFVAVDPTTLIPAPNAGDRIDITLNAKGTLNGLTTATSVTLNAVLSTGHPVRNLSTDTPAGVNTDVTNFPDLVTNVGTYASDLVHVLGYLDGGASGGAGHAAFLLTTQGIPATTSSFRLRVSEQVRDQLDLVSGCSVNVVAGPLWRFNATSEPSAYSPADLRVVGCSTPPRVVEASSPSPTTVVVVFDRQIRPASVTIGSFAIPGLVVTSATVGANPYLVTLGVTGELAATRYTVTVTGVTDLYGTPVGTPNTATFWASASGPDAGALVINELEYDEVSTDSAEFIELYNRDTAPVSIGDLELILVNGTNTSITRREYGRVRLSAAVDETGTPRDSLPPGGFLVVAMDAGIFASLDAGVLRVALPAALWDGPNFINGAGPDTQPNSYIQNGGALQPDGGSNGSDGVTLMNVANGQVVDTVFYEPGPDNDLYTTITAIGDVTFRATEGTRTTAQDLSPGVATIGRDPAGTDTDNNDNDIKGKAVQTPGAPNP